MCEALQSLTQQTHRYNFVIGAVVVNTKILPVTESAFSF